MRRLLAVILLLALVAPVSACGKGGGQTQKPAPSGGGMPVERTQVSIGLWDLQPAVAGKPSGTIRDAFADRFGVEFVPWAVSSEDWKDTIGAAAAAGTLPDMFVHGIYDDALSFRQLVDGKHVREIPEAIYKQYERLGAVMYRYRKTESLDGAMWFIPRADMSTRYDNGQSTAIWYRLDWALESGLITAGQALTWQQFMSLMAYYARIDLDGNGCDDTWALTSGGDGLGGLGTAFFMAFGVRDWVLEAGNWIPGMLSTRAKDAVKWANQAFRSGCIDADFASQSEEGALQKFCEGKAGMLVADATPAGAERLRAMLQAKQPGLDIRKAVSLLPQPENPWGVSYNEDVSYHTGILFAAGVDDGKLKKVLALMDWLMTEEGLTLVNWGEKGKDYNVTGDGLQTLRRDDKNLPVTFGQTDAQWRPMAQLATWGMDFMPAASEDDYRWKYLNTLKDGWWTNNWRRPMFTRYIADPAVQGFDADSRAEKALALMIMRSSDVDRDWEAYALQMAQELNVESVAKIVNDYAREHNIKTEE